jgi:hypothetical protein
MIRMYGLNYCADHTNGKLYEYTPAVFTDDGESIVKERDTATIHGGLYQVQGKKLFFDKVQFIIVGGETAVTGTGAGAQPTVKSMEVDLATTVFVEVELSETVIMDII